jgi:hypothetical protein
MEFISQLTVCTTEHSLAFMQITFQVGAAADNDVAAAAAAAFLPLLH